MKKILLGLLLSLVFLGCSSDTQAQNIPSALQIFQPLKTITLNDQFGNPQTLSKDTQKIIFAFSKDMGHMCNEFFASKGPTYLKDHKAVFIADLSSAPSLIRSMFILPGLKDFKHQVLILEDKELAAPYKVKQNVEKALVVTIINDRIATMEAVSTPNELIKNIE